MNLRVAVAFSLVLLAASAANAQGFYSTRYERGLNEYRRGNYAAAAQSLRIASFGLLDSVPEYETAQIYFLLACEKLERTADVAAAAAKIVQAERVEPSYEKLNLDPQIRAAFEAALPKLVKPQQLARVPAFAKLASAAPAQPQSKPQPQPTPQVATPRVAPKSAAPPMPRASASDRALAAFEAGDYGNARKLANLAVASDATNALAQTVLAQLGWRDRDWKAVADHYAVVRTRRRLTNEENARFYAALLRAERTIDAEGVRRILPAAVLSMPEVTQAIADTRPKPAPPPPMAAQAPAPKTPPKPAPQTAQPKPQPQPQPQPQSTQAVVASPAPASGQQVSPLVAIARHQPGAPGTVNDVATKLIEADRLLREGKVAAARDAYLHLTNEPATNRDLSLEIAKGLNRTSAFRESSNEYRKLYPLKRGEEMHMLYEAENRYELGDLETARQILAVALPSLPKTKEVDLYKGKIQGGR